jgi:hypothetical protein
MRRATQLLLCLLWGTAWPCAANPLPDGYDALLLNANANAEVRDSAAVLADLLGRVHQHPPELRRAPLWRLRPAIHIGPAPDHPAFDDDPLTDEIIIERTTRGIHIHGSDNTATRFAIHRFIEVFLGWRAYQPGELGLERLDAPPAPPAVHGPAAVLLRETASFASRHPSFGRGEAARDWETWHGVRERFHYNHTLHRVVPPTRFDTDPDWFAKDARGQPMRPPYYPRAHGYNDHPDLTQPAVRAWVARRTLAAIARDTAFEPARPAAPGDPATLPPVRQSPGVVSVSLSLGDSFVFGEFPESYPWRPDGYFRRWPDWSNHVFAYTNAVAEQVQAGWQAGSWDGGARPRLLIGALAYLNWENLPDFPLHPYIVPYLTFDRSQWYDPAARADDLANVARWQASGAPFLGTWDYLFGYGFLIPRSMTRIVAESIPALHAHGVRAYFSQVAPLWPYDGHTNWLTTRLLWNAGQDAEALLEEYFAEYFGPAREPMEAFFARAERIWMSQPGAGWWLRYWKDPWQVGLFGEADLDALEAHLTAARAASREGAREAAPNGLSAQRFVRRVEQVEELFALTRALHLYQSRTWNLQTTDWENADAAQLRRGGQLATEALEARRQLIAARDQAVAHNPLLGYARDLEWVFLYDSLGAATAAMLQRARAIGPDGANLEQMLLRHLAGWAESLGYGAPQAGLAGWGNILFDTDFSRVDDRRIWHRQVMDSEGGQLGRNIETGQFSTRDIRRGHIYQLFRAEPGDWYLGWIDLVTRQSLSGEVYIRVDFFDAANQLLASSPRSRIAPVDRFGERQRLRALLQAPESAVHGRLFIRFYEMDPDSRARLLQAGVVRMTSPAP